MEIVLECDSCETMVVVQAPVTNGGRRFCPKWLSDGCFGTVNTRNHLLGVARRLRMRRKLLEDLGLPVGKRPTLETVAISVNIDRAVGALNHAMDEVARYDRFISLNRVLPSFSSNASFVTQIDEQHYLSEKDIRRIFNASSKNQPFKRLGGYWHNRYTNRNVYVTRHADGLVSYRFCDENLQEYTVMEHTFKHVHRPGWGG